VNSIGSVPCCCSFVTVDQHVYHGVVLDVRNDAARSDKVNLVNAHPLRRLETDGAFQRVHVDVVFEDQANGALNHADFLSDAGEGALYGLLANPVHQMTRHGACFVCIGQRFSARHA
jgi:hypothetical protein